MAASFNKWFPAGFRLINGLSLNSWFNNPQTSVENAITASTGSTQATAVQLSAAMSRISVCANAGDAVRLPKASLNVGASMVVVNDGAQNADVFPYSGDNIDAVGADTAVSVDAGQRCFFFCPAPGIWQSGIMVKA